MDRSVTTAEACSGFARLLDEVREQNRSFVITTDGKPVARIVPVEHMAEDRTKARLALYARLQKRPVTDIGPWTREELYER
jgi:prevent-host-death family protein